MKYTTDVLVIGAGGAGMRAAIEAADGGAKVILLGKTLLGKAHTVMAEGGINAALGNRDPEDNWKVHFKDTMLEGQLLNDWKMVEAMTKQAPDVIRELEHYGALFDRNPKGKVMQRAFGGHSFRRTCHIGDRTGLEIMQVLMAEVRKRENIKNLEEVIITKVARNSNHVTGAVGISLRTGKQVVINCKAVILATGGHARIYRRSTNAWETVGDGYALALDAGAALQDMEMVQFHPTGMVFPKGVEGILVTESVRGEGGILLNAKGERFMEKYDPKKMELSTRDIVSRAVFNEIKKGNGTKRRGVWLDISHKSKHFIHKKLPKMIDKFRDFADVDITKEKMEVAPTAHYAMGGVRVDADTCQSNVKGLFACGEISAGVHGANRLGGNSLIDILVFGRITGKHAAFYCRNKKETNVNPYIIEKERERVSIPLENDKGIRPIVLKKELQKVMWADVGIIRDKETLTKALKKIQSIKEKLNQVYVYDSKSYNHDWVQYLDVMAMIPTCEAVIQSALLRKESRGAHYRSDFPDKNDKRWLKNILVRMDKGKLKLSSVPVSLVPKKLKGYLK